MDPSGEFPSQELPQHTPETRMKMFQRVNEMVKEGQVKIPSGNIQMSEAGQTSSKDTAEFLDSMESMDIKDAKPNDVIWWQTKNSRNYFVVEKITPDGKIKGSFQSFREDGTDGRSFEDAVLKGASKMSDVLVTGKILKGVPVELGIPDPEITGEIPSRRIYTTTRAVDMGTIKGSEIKIEE